MGLVLYSLAGWKIADFGLTSEGTSRLFYTTTGARGTACYRAPELLQFPKATYNNKVDIWSMGCIMYEIIFGRKAFNNDWEVFKHSESSEPTRFPNAIFDGYADTDISQELALISEMLSFDPSYRPAARSLTERFSEKCSSRSNIPTSPSPRAIPRFERFPRILSLDDGGIRGLSSLFILRGIMEKIRAQTKATETPLPCQYFDLIGGSGTGGLIAIMLGLLEMANSIEGTY
jgi:serine/threonine protein kinase